MIYRACRSTVRFPADGTYLQIVRHLQNIRFTLLLDVMRGRMFEEDNFEVQFWKQPSKSSF